MDFETTQINAPPRRIRGPVRGTISGIGEVIGTSIDLSSLQLRLVKADAQQAALRVRPVLAAAALALGMTISSLPVLGLGFASFISTATPLTLWQSQLLVGGTFLLIAALPTLCFWLALRPISCAFDRSQQEAKQNIQWLRNAVRQISR